MCSIKWYIQGTCATQGTGLYEGLDWLSNELSKWEKKTFIYIYSFFFKPFVSTYLRLWAYINYN